MVLSARDYPDFIVGVIAVIVMLRTEVLRVVVVYRLDNVSGRTKEFCWKFWGVEFGGGNFRDV